MKSGRLLRDLFLLTVGIAAGLGFAWFFWQVPSETRPAVSGEFDVPDIQTTDSQADDAESADVDPRRVSTEFERHEQAAINLMSSLQYAAALESLLEADLVAMSDAEIRQVSTLLEEAVRLRVSQLNALGRSNEIDALYERLTFTMPERVEYYILLAEHRIAMDSPDTALPVLAQIENHHQLGGRARELIDSITAVNQQAPVDVVDLRRVRDQYLVTAALDDSISVALLLDTGASMTVVDPDILDRLGYSLTGRQARFSTAGGVVQAPLVSVSALMIGESRVEPLTVGALNIEGHSAEVDGLLGMDFLRHFEFSLDQDARRLILHSRR
jgi:clan AA aspartic protease (TIGR02281 family)